MEVEKAIITAIDYEMKVRDVYASAVANSKNETAKRLFKQLAKEEQGHIDYLESRLTEWKRTGKLKTKTLETTIPTKGAIEDGVKKLEGKMKEADKFGEAQMLTKALDVEIETSKFYEQMVDQLEAEPQRMFKRFLEIEEGHLAIVQAELDSLNGTGFWFDFREFNLESEG
jgi:rubrerythrin